MVEVIQGIKSEHSTVIPFGKLDFRFGMFYNIYGRQKSGKTAICFYLSNELIKKGFNVFYIETEKRLPNYEAVYSKSYQKNFEKLYLPPIPLFEFDDKTDEVYFERFTSYMDKLIKDKKINVIVIYSIIHPLKDIHPKISGKIVTRFFNYFYENIIIKHNIMGIIVSHSWVDYNSETKTPIEVPRGSRQSRYIPNKTLQTIMNENVVKLANGSKRYIRQKEYSLNFHKTSVPFIINEVGTIDKIE